MARFEAKPRIEHEAPKFEPQLGGRPVVNIVVNTVVGHVELARAVTSGDCFCAVCGDALKTGVVGDCEVGDCDVCGRRRHAPGVCPQAELLRSGRLTSTDN